MQDLLQLLTTGALEICVGGPNSPLCKFRRILGEDARTPSHQLGSDWEDSSVFRAQLGLGQLYAPPPMPYTQFNFMNVFLVRFSSF